MKYLLTSLLFIGFCIANAQIYTDDFTVSGGSNYEAIDAVTDNDTKTFVLGSITQSGTKKGILRAYNEELNGGWNVVMGSGDDHTPIGVVRRDDDTYLFVATNTDVGDATLFVLDETNEDIASTINLPNTTIHAFDILEVGLVTYVFLAGVSSGGDAYLARCVIDDRGELDVGGLSTTTYAGSSNVGAGYLDVIADPSGYGVVAVGYDDKGSYNNPIISVHSEINLNRLETLTMDHNSDFDESRGMKLHVEVNSPENIYIASYLNDDLTERFYLDYFYLNNNILYLTDINESGTTFLADIDATEKLVDLQSSVYEGRNGTLVLLTTHQLITFGSQFNSSGFFEMIQLKSLMLPDPNDVGFSVDQEGSIYLGSGSSDLNFTKYDAQLNELETATSSSGNAQNFGAITMINNSPFLSGSSSSGLHTSQFCFAPSIQFDETISEYDSHSEVYFICPDVGAVITPTIPSGATFSWRVDPNIADVNTLVQTLDEVGTYYLDVTTISGCESSRAVTIRETTDLPSKAIRANSQLISNTNSPNRQQSIIGPLNVPLQGLNTPDGSNTFLFEYLWYKVDGGTETFIGLTTNDETINVTEPGEYYAQIEWVASIYGTCAYQKTYSVTFEQLPIITFAPIPAKEFGDPDFNLDVTLSSPATVEYTSTAAHVATVDENGLVTIHGVGSTDLRARVFGSYGTNSEQVQTLVVSQANQTITFGALSDIKFSDGPVDLTATASSGLDVSYASSNESIVTINNGQAHPAGVGTVTITASQSGNSNVNAAPDVDQSLTVLKGDQIIDFDPITGPFDVSQNSFAISADASSSLPVTITSSDETVLSVSGTTVNIIGAGTATLTASQAGNSLYNAAPDVNQEITVDKLTQTVTVPDLSGNTYTFGLSASPFNVSNSAGIENMIFESSDEDVFVVQNITDLGAGFYTITLGIVGVGTATFTATQPGDDTYESASDFTTITVAKANQSITFSSLSPVFFGDSNFELSASAGSGLPVTFASSDPTVATVTGTTVTIVGAGTTTITASQPGNENYNPATDVNQDLTVMQLVQTIDFDTDLPANNVFGDGPFSFNATASSGLPVTFSVDDESVITVAGGVATIHGAGSATITATQAGNQNYVAQQNDFNVSVDLADQTITFGLLDSKQFGDPSFDLDATTTSGLPINYSSGDESVATIVGNTVTIVGVGSTVITASQGGNANYYAAGNVNRTLIVDKADQSITFGELNDISPGEMITLAASASSGLAVTFNVSGPASLVGNDLTTTGAGTVTVTATQAGNANYNAAPDVMRTFDVVDKMSQSITFPDITVKAFGDNPFNLNASASSGLAVSYMSSDVSVATVSGSTVTIVGVGSTTITASQPGDDDYHPALDVDKVLTVNKADQTVAFDLGSNSTKTFGDASFAHGASASSGLEVVMESSDPSVVTVDDNNVEIVGAGTATITATQPGNENYNAASPVDQVITVAKANQVIVFDPSVIPDQALSDGSVTFDAYAETGNPLTVSVKSGPATVVDVGPDFYEVTFTGSGDVVIEANVDETDDYLASTAEIQFEIVDDSKQSQTITFSTLSSKTFGDAAFELTGTASSGLSLSYVSSDENVATIAGATVTIVGAGTADITASQSGDSDFHPAADVTQTLTVNKADQTISITPISDKSISDDPFDVSAQSDSSLPLSFSLVGPATISGETITLDGTIGTVTVTASQAGNVNYNSAEAEESFEVLSVTLGLKDEIDVKVYPNPARNFLTVQSTKPVEVAIFTTDGKLLLQQKSADDPIDIQSLSAGTYLLKLSRDGKTASVRFLKR